MDIKQTLSDEGKAVAAEAKAEGSAAMIWIEGHPAIMGALLVGVVIGFVFGYLVGSYWKG